MTARKTIYPLLLLLFCSIPATSCYAISIIQDDTSYFNEPVILQEIYVSSEKPNTNVVRPGMSIEKLAVKQIKLIPALFGEIDLIKVIQMLPGVQAASEGSSGFSVRGGSPDQNLILFDNAVVYNASHLMGFFSTFNNDAVEGLTLYKGDIPATQGGRLSSLLDIQGQTGTNEFGFNAGIGLIASRLMLQGPLVSDRATFLVAGRRTYADLFLPLASEENIRDISLYFYDLNIKLQGRIDDKNRLSFTAYYGRDKYGGGETGLHFGNMTGTLRWNHIFSENFYAQIELLAGGYDYRMSANSPTLVADWNAGIYSLGRRSDFTFLLNDHSFRFGWNSDYKWYNPGKANAVIENSDTYTIAIADKQTWENVLYFANQHLFFDKFTLKYGLRTTRFDNIGPTTEYLINDNYTLTDSLTMTPGKFYNHYWGIEPRMGLTWLLNEATSLKASYSRTMQFIHLLSTSTAGSPLEVWIPSNLTVKPESAHQFATGLFANLWNNRFEFSFEIYYKNLQDVIDFKDHPKVLGNDIIETEIRTGSGKNYGLELMLRKNTGKLSGWISYTYSRAFRNIPEINNGNDYQAPFDRPNNINIILSYPFNKRISASVNWIYSTGQPVTFPEARYVFNNDYIPVFTARNTYRFPDYHRMDVSVDITLGKIMPHKKWHHTLNISVYNLYGRKNPWTINFRTDPDNSQYAQMTYLFGIVPSITYNLHFNTP